MSKVRDILVPTEADMFHLHKYLVRSGDTAFKTMEKYLKEYDVGRLALTGEEYPYVIPMNHYYKDAKFYWHCAFVGKKHTLSKKNPKACYVVDGGVKPLARDERYDHHPWVSVVCYGIIDEVLDPAERLEILKVYTKRQGGPPVEMERAKTCNLMRFTIEKMTARYGRFTPAENRHLLYWEKEK